MFFSTTVSGFGTTNTDKAINVATVGGDVLDLAFKRAKPHARFVICGGKE